MEQIKENMFFVVCGVIVLLAVAFQVVGVRHFRMQNEQTLEQTAVLAGKLGKFADSPFLANASAVAAAGQYRQAYEQEFRQIVDLFRTKSLPGRLPGDMARVVMKEGGDLVGDIVSKDDKTVSVVQDNGRYVVVNRGDVSRIENEVSKPAIFSTVYRGLVREVQNRMASDNFIVSKDAWAFWDWGTGLPDSEIQRVTAAKEYYLTTEIVDVIKRPELGIIALDKLEIDPGVAKNEQHDPARQGRTRVGDYFEAIPFVLTVKIDFQNWRLLVDELLRSDKTPILMRRVNMARLTSTERSDPQLARRLPVIPPPAYVTLQLECWALDYKEATQETKTTGLMQRGGPGGK